MTVTRVTLVNTKGTFLWIYVDSLDETAVRLAANAAKDALNLDRPNPKYGEWFIEEFQQILKEEN
jgi:hypothetical protein